MVILAIADRAPRFSILETIKKYSVDIVCTLGDLKYNQLVELEHVSSIPKIGVYGNHCMGNYFESLGIKNMHLTTFEYMGIKFGGFEGSVRYKESGEHMFTQAQAIDLLKGFPYVDIMLAHSPPYMINDEPYTTSHQGLIALRKYIDEVHPKYLFHGHTSPTEDSVINEYNGTRIVFVSQDQVLRI